MDRRAMWPAIAWTALGSYCATIFWLSAQSHPPGLDQLHTSDKLLHAIAFSMMGALATFAARASFRRLRDAHCAAIGFAFAVLYGISDEIHQRWTPGRTPDPLDAAADALGAGLACLAVYALIVTVRQRRASTAGGGGAESVEGTK